MRSIDMRADLSSPLRDDRPLVGDVEALADSQADYYREERDEAIIRLLRDKLREREARNMTATKPILTPAAEGTEGEDKYEPQRLSRKICWQYDSSARKVPLLRRHYI